MTELVTIPRPPVVAREAHRPRLAGTRALIAAVPLPAGVVVAGIGVGLLVRAAHLPILLVLAGAVLVLAVVFVVVVLREQVQ